MNQYPEPYPAEDDPEVVELFRLIRGLLPREVESEGSTVRSGEIYRLLEALGDVVDKNSLGSWFQSPNEAFEGLKPIEVIERGEIDRLWIMVFELRSGTPG